MPRIALIQDGTEVARQWVADVAGAVAQCCAVLSENEVEGYSVQSFTDEDVGYLLDGIERDEWACLVFASNALLSAQVEKALTSNRSSLRRYISSGGGVVVLHEQRDSLAPLLPDALLPRMDERRSKRGSTALSADDPEDLLLHYPRPVAWQKLRDLQADELRAAGDLGTDLPSLFFKTLDRKSLPSTLKPVLSASGDEVVVARTGDHVAERVVIATAPLDWELARPGQEDATSALLVNALRYAAVGMPRRLVWRRGKGVSNQLLVRWLAIDDGAALLPAPAEERALDPIESWLLTTVDVFVLPADRLDWAERQPEVQRFLEQGGAVIAAADLPSGRTRVSAIVGRYEERTLATRLYAELRAIDGWRAVTYAFELRNIVRALAFLWDEEINRTDAAALAPYALEELAAEIKERLADPGHREDLSSSIALAETLAYVLEDAREGAADAEWLADEAARRPLDLALQIRAVLALADGAPPPDFLKQAVEAFAGATSLAPVVRVLDSVAVLDQAGLLDGDAEDATRLAEVACSFLDRSPVLPDRGWLSVEGTGQLTRGLVALHARLASDRPDVAARVVGHVATGATALRRALRRYERNPKGAAWLASIVHAVIVADREFPIGLQRLASLEWPDRTPADAASARVERALLQQLAVENEKLRDTARDTQQQLEEERRNRLAASIGRGVATLVPVAALAVAAWVVLRQVGWDTFGGVVANVVILISLGATLLASLFALLESLHLLARPAPRVLRFVVERVVPTVEAGGKIKRG